jgi:acetyl-CoA acyltransferase
MPEGEQGLNVARIASLRAGIPVEASAVTINRFCSSGLQAIRVRGRAHHDRLHRSRDCRRDRVHEHGSDGREQVSPNPALVDSYPDVYLSTGLVAEHHARESGISREAQDAFALRSHQRAIAAIESGRFAEEITPLAYRVVLPGNGAPTSREMTFAETRVRGATRRPRRSRS